MFKVNNKDTRTKPVEVVALSFGPNWTQKQPPEAATVLKKFAIITGKQLCWNLV